jgi:hypothetical protein
VRHRFLRGDFWQIVQPRHFRISKISAVGLGLTILLLALCADSATAQEQCGAAVCGGGLQCLTCAGGSTCVKPPAECCGTGVCGDGLTCMSCAGGPTCAKPPAECCGSGVCGDGLKCVDTPRGPECQTPISTPIPESPPATEKCGTSECGGGLVCMRCPGAEPTCARPPAECCGSATCGDGLKCISCSGNSTCARPPAVCCGNIVCGDGLVCAQTPNGPTCARPAPQTPMPGTTPGAPGKAPGAPPPGPRPPQIPGPDHGQSQTPGPTQPQVPGPGQGKFRSRWDQVGGSWTTGWVNNHPFLGCTHGITCQCGAENYCGNYSSGQTTTAWPQGCKGPRWTIRCTSEVQPTAKPPKPEAKPVTGPEGPWFCCQWTHPVLKTTTCAPSRDRANCRSRPDGKVFENSNCVLGNPPSCSPQH